MRLSLANSVVVASCVNNPCLVSGDMVFSKKLRNTYLNTQKAGLWIFVIHHHQDNEIAALTLPLLTNRLTPA